MTAGGSSSAADDQGDEQRGRDAGPVDAHGPKAPFPPQLEFDLKLASTESTQRLPALPDPRNRDVNRYRDVKAATYTPRARPATFAACRTSRDRMPGALRWTLALGL